MFKSAEQLPIQSHENFNDETRHSNDTVTWLAETIHGSMRTSFDYHFDGQELYAEDGGAMGEVFDQSISSAVEIVKLNPNLFFELRRRITEKGEYEDMLKMAKNELLDTDGNLANTMVVVSDYPEELMHSSEDIGGYNSSRKQTMLRVISRQNNGDIRMVTQSLDGSNRQALEAIYTKMDKTVITGELLEQRINLSLPEEWQPELVNNLQNTYDQSLTRQFGGNWHAGIEQINKDRSVNTAEFVKKQKDLIEWFVDKKLNDSVAAEKLRYGLAATIKERFERSFIPGHIATYNQAVYLPVLENRLNMEINSATQRAANRGDSFSGCGLKVGAENGINSQLEESGFGNKTDEDEYGSLNFKCTKGHTNTRPRGRLIDKCQSCNVSVRC